MPARNRVLILGLMLPLAALAADPESVDKPKLQVGTTWRTVVSDALTRAVITDTQYRISAIDDAEVQISDGSGQVAIVLDAADNAVKRFGDREFDPPLRRFRYPLTVGNRWETAYAYHNPQCGPTQSKLNYRVAGWEDISVPAGKFRALKLEAEGTWRNGCGGDRHTQKLWVVPDLGVPVRLEAQTFVQNRVRAHEVQELQSFSKP